MPLSFELIDQYLHALKSQNPILLDIILYSVQTDRERAEMLRLPLIDDHISGGLSFAADRKQISIFKHLLDNYIHLILEAHDNSLQFVIEHFDYSDCCKLLRKFIFSNQQIQDTLMFLKARSENPYYQELHGIFSFYDTLTTVIYQKDTHAQDNDLLPLLAGHDYEIFAEVLKWSIPSSLEFVPLSEAFKSLDETARHQWRSQLTLYTERCRRESKNLEPHGHAEEQPRRRAKVS
jgi:hypothetical protein